MNIDLDFKSFAHYLPVEPDALAWGAYVKDSGFAHVPENTQYPFGEHPDGYMFTWKSGRILSEYQLLYITNGQGRFESRSGGKHKISAGQIILLFPGEWHRYQPTKDVGWDEYWLGFDGSHAKEIMSHFFSPRKPIITIGQDEELVSLFQSIAELIQIPRPGSQQLMAARALEALARIRMLALSFDPEHQKKEDMIQKVKMFMLASSGAELNFKDLAKELNMSYSTFRREFTQRTGTSPRQYQLQIRINKAKSFLQNTRISVTDLATKLGFSSVYYFSRFFKAKTGLSPKQFRQQSQQSPR